MKIRGLYLAVALSALALLGLARAASADPWWGQWAQGPQHRGAANVFGNSPANIQADIVYDPFALVEENDPNAYGALLVHYQSPLLDGNDVFMEQKSGLYSGLLNWTTQTWGEGKFTWQNGQLQRQWTVSTDWKPVPYGTSYMYGSWVGPSWEPVFHGVLTNDALYVPAFAGSVWKVDRSSGAVLALIQPFGTVDPNRYTVGPLAADSSGNVYYNVIKLPTGQNVNPWTSDTVGSWLVKIAADGTSRVVSWATLVPGTPAPNAKCDWMFNYNQLPWPVNKTATPPKIKCGSQRPPINTTPAIGPDGTIYELSVAALNKRWGYLLAINPDLTPKWVASLRNRFNDGCGVELPANGAPGGCRVGTMIGVDPADNEPGSGIVHDDSTAAPVVAPDGSIYVGVYTRYNYAQGHLVHFSASGAFLNSYHFGWDTTPAIFAHDGTYSVITKENRYGDVGSYCNNDYWCPPDRNATNPANPVKYYLTQLNPALAPEWTWQNTNQLSCSRDTSGTVSCINTGTQPDGFEWCVNSPAVDHAGNVYGASEDGWLYVVGQGGNLQNTFFTRLAVGAAYTPMAIDANGRIFTQNQGELFVLGQ